MKYTDYLFSSIAILSPLNFHLSGCSRVSPSKPCILLWLYYQTMLIIWLPLLILTLNLNQVTCWTTYTDIRTGRVDLFNSVTSSGSVLTSSSAPQSYSITYIGSISQTKNSGLGIVGFQTYVTNSFSINLTITNFITTSMTITGRVLDDTSLTYLSINYIAVGTAAYFLEVQFYCFLPTILSTGTGTRTQTKTSTTTFTNLALSCNVYLSGWRLTNSAGINDYLSSSVTCPTGTSNLNYAFVATENNLATQICYTTVIFCDVCTKSSTDYMEWGETGQTTLSYSLLPLASNINSATLSRYTQNNRMFWGITSFNMSRGFIHGFNFQNDYYSTSGANLNTNYLTYVNQGTYEIILTHFYIATRDCNLTNQQFFQVPTQTCVTNNCWSNLTYTLNGSNNQYCTYCDYTCLTCDGSLSTNCKTCLNTTFRSLSSNSCPCQTGYIDIGVATCYPCDYYISGCTACTSTTSCTSCSSGFTLTALGQCQCTTGFLVTGVCTTIVGCISATNLQGSVYCLACNTSSNYYRSQNFTCLCNSGFTTSATQECIIICGDGIIVNGQACDDGNLINGDGCSDLCTVETNFYCDNSDPPSECFIITNVTAQLKSVQRVLTANRATFVIDLQPEYDQYSNMDFLGYVSTDIPCSQVTYAYTDDLLVFNCSYSKTIEGSTYTFNLTLDPRYFASNTKVSLTIPALGMNAKLTYDNNYNMYTPLQMLVLVLDIIAIIVLLASCVTERMIGVQMIQTLQSVLYSMALMKTCPSTLAPLQSLRYSNGYNQLNGVDPIRRYTYAFSIGQVGLDQQFLLNYNISYFILILVILLLLSFKVLTAKFELDKFNQEKEFNRKIEMDQMHKSYKYLKKGFKVIFQRIFFVLCFMNMFLVMFAVGVQFSSLQQAYNMMTGEFNLLACGVAICILVTFLSMVIINGYYPVIRLFPMFMKENYPVYYVVYNSTFIFMIAYLYTKTWVLYFLLLMAICNLIYSMTYMPYRQKLHNLTLAINQSTIILALATYLYEESTPVTNNNEGIFTITVLIIIVMLYICVILSIYRLYRFYQYMKINKLSYDLEEEQDKSDKNTKQPLRQNQNDVQNMDNDKIQGLKTSKALQPFQKEMYQESKLNKGPLKSARVSENGDNSRQKNNLSKSRRQNEQDFDTFSKNKSKNSPFEIDPIDPNPKEVSASRSPYNQFGQIKLHNHKDEEQERDALKEIKARLRKDFYHKVRQTQYREVSEREQLLNKRVDKPVNFEPSDYNE